MHVYDMMSGWGAGSGWWSWPMWIGMIAFWAGFVVLVVWLVRGMVTGSTHAAPSVAHESPQDILRRRYAAGDIDREEFEQKKRDLF